MPTDLPHTNKIVRESSGSIEAAAIAAKFGDGLSQAAPRSMNPITEVWEITWRLTEAEFNDVMSVLRSVGTWGILTWTTPYEGRSLLWRVSGSRKPSWQRGGVANSKFIVSCTLEQYHGV
jgi:phage-related protein